MNYQEFASKISFFEFNQKEFYNSDFNAEDYKDEFKKINSAVSIDKLTKILETNPKIFDIFEDLFQLSRFTNAQYIHFCFDINVLNNADNDTIINYAEKSIFKFENLSENIAFKQIFNNKFYTDKKNQNSIILNIKRSIPTYIDKCLKKRTVFYNHISNSISTRLRISKYLIENLRADEYVKSINIEKFVQLKRKPKDSKNIHGNFGNIKISKILDDVDIQNIDRILTNKTIPLSTAILSESYSKKFVYCREKYVENIKKRKTNKFKKFDFVIFYDRLPVIFIETNFYSTSGTKIGINEGEYTDLIQDINTISRKIKRNLMFMWITDGNYWLTKDGENRYKNLKTNYFKNDYELLNYNLLKNKLNDITELIKNGQK